MKRLLRYSLGVLVLANTLAAQNPSSLLGVSVAPSKGSLSLSAPMQIIVLLTLLAILPAVIMSVTPFLRITVVLHFLRQALNTQGTPSNQVLIGLALFLTLVIMQPVVTDMYHKGWEPLEAGQATWQQAWKRWLATTKDFLAALCPGKRRAPVSGNLSYSRAAGSVRARAGGPDAGLRAFRTENRLSDWRHPVPAVLGHRFGGRVGDSLHWHGAIAADHALSPLQDPFVCAGGRMESGDRLPDAELLSV